MSNVCHTVDSTVEIHCLLNNLYVVANYCSHLHPATVFFVAALSNVGAGSLLSGQSCLNPTVCNAFLLLPPAGKTGHVSSTVTQKKESALGGASAASKGNLAVASDATPPNAVSCLALGIFGVEHGSSHVVVICSFRIQL